MSGAAFTPGPWHYGDEDESVVGVHYVDVHAGEYCTASYRCTASVEGPFVDGEFGPLDEETRANARLIAAAPELYEALEALVKEANGFELWQRPYGTLEPAMAALAKARGAA